MTILDCIEACNQIILSIASFSLPNVEIRLMLAINLGVFGEDLTQSHPDNVIFGSTYMTFSVH